MPSIYGSPPTTASFSGAGSGRHGNYYEDSDEELPVCPLEHVPRTLVPTPSSSSVLLAKLSEGSLPSRRIQIPNQTPKHEVYVSNTLHNLGAELNATSQKQSLRKKGAVVLKDERVAFLKKPSMTKKEHTELTKSVHFHLVRIGPSAKDSDFAYVRDVDCRGKKSKDSLLTVIWCTPTGQPTDWTGIDTDPVSLHLFDVDYIKPLLDIEEVHQSQELSDCQFFDLIRCPKNEMCRNPMFDLAYRDIDQELVPCNRDQFRAIRNIGCQRIVVIQGPPGTGKSTTVANGILHRLKFGRQAIVVSERRQAVGAVAEKLAAIMTDPIDPRAEVEEEDKFAKTMTIVGATDHLMKKLPSPMKRFCIDVQVKRLVDARPDVKDRKSELSAVKKLCERIESDRSSTHQIELLSEYKDRMWKEAFVKKDQALRRLVTGLDIFILQSKPMDFQGYADHVGAKKECTSMNAFLDLFLRGWEQHWEWFYRKHTREIESHILSTSTVTLSTIGTLYTKRMRQMKGVHSIYIDEAATVSEESMAIMAIMEPTTLVVVGDHKQLRPYTNCRLNLASKEDDVMRSFFERCVDVEVGYSTLSSNFRNPAAIIDVANITTYDGQLMLGRGEDHGAPDSIVWVDHPHKENDLRENETSRYNEKEVDVVVSTYKRIIRQYPGKNVAISTFYKGQFSRLERRLDSIMRPQDSLVTVDSCQGSEYDIVIISCVRCNQYSGVGFCKHENRLNVATTRSRFQLIFVGSKSTFCLASPEWEEWCKHAKTEPC